MHYVMNDVSIHTASASAVSNHGNLRGIANPVLTATRLSRLALSMGKGIFRPPTKSTPLNRSPKICHRRLAYVGDPNSCAKFDAHPSTGSSGRMGEI